MNIEWITATVIGFLSLIGIGKLGHMAYGAKLERKKIRDDLDKATAAKHIDADVNAFEAINTRLALVESRLDVVNQQLTEQRVENARLEAENLSLRKDNERQGKELDQQRVQLQEFAKALEEVRKGVNGQTERLVALTQINSKAEGVLEQKNKQDKIDELKIVPILPEIVKVEIVEGQHGD